ncbi:MAG: cation diffusion facilitator family transporter [Candidatus Binatia bacterium]
MGHRDHGGERGAIATGLGVSSLLFVGELAAGWWTNSLALMSDAAHVFADAAALGLALFALWIGPRPAGPSKTYGYYRAEILAALVNGVVLWVVVFFIAVEAWGRLRAPAPVAGKGMLVAAALGLAANVFVAARLRAHKEESLNLRGAYLHVISDLLGSVGALAAAVVILTTGWQGADAVASLVIAGLILVSSWSLVREAVDVLMEAVPPHVDVDALQRGLEGCAGVDEVHDLHVWTLTTGHYALSAHAVVDGSVSDGRILDAMAALCAERFHIDHVTIQLEHESRRAAEPAH